VLAAVVLGNRPSSGAGFLIYAQRKKARHREAGDRIAAQTLYVPPEEDADKQQSDTGKPE
jgi:hypothetical protein